MRMWCDNARTWENALSHYCTYMRRTMVQLIYHILLHVDNLHRKIFHSECWEFRLLCDKWRYIGNVIFTKQSSWSTKRRRPKEQIMTIKRQIWIKVTKDCLWKQRTHKITKIGDSVWLSLFICNTKVCEAAHATQRRLKRYLIFKITMMGSVIPKEIKYNLHYDDVRGGVTPPQDTTPAVEE